VSDGAAVDTLDVGPVPEYRRKPGLVSYTLDIPPGARRRGFDTIVVMPARGQEPYAVGHLLLEGVAAAGDAELFRRVAERDAAAAR
jgi:hypothetical protein